MSEYGNTLHCVGFATEESLAQARLECPNVQWSRIAGSVRGMSAALSSLPMVAARHRTRAYERFVEEISRAQFDVVILDQYALGWTVPILTKSHDRPLLVHISHDYETGVNRDIANNFQGNPLTRHLLHSNAAKTARMEKTLVASVDIVTSITEEDSEKFRALGGAAKHLVLRPGYDGPIVLARQITESTPRRVAIFGSFRWIAKIMNLERFLLAADAKFDAEGIELIIVGEVDRRLRERWRRKLRATTFMGFVDDPRSVLADCRIGLNIDETGGGFKLKLLDYVFARLPVVSVEGALGGTGSKLRTSIGVAPDLETIPDLVIEIIDDLERLNVMQSGAFESARGNFNWHKDAQVLSGLIERLITSERA